MVRVVAALALLVVAAAALAGCSSDGLPTPTGDSAISSTPVEATAGSGDPTVDPGDPSASDSAEPVDPPPTPGETPLDPNCLLLETGEVADVLGSDVEEGMSVLGGCEWLGEPEDASLQLLTNDIAQAECEEAFDGDEAQEAVSGLGAPAYQFYDELIGRATVTVCLELTMVALNVTAGAGDPAIESALLADARELAAQVVDRL